MLLIKLFFSFSVSIRFAFQILCTEKATEFFIFFEIIIIIPATRQSEYYCTDLFFVLSVSFNWKLLNRNGGGSVRGEENNVFIRNQTAKIVN